MGTYFYIYTGAKPLVRKKDLIKLCEVHSDAIFMCFTNGTLIDEQFAADMMRVKKLRPRYQRGRGTRSPWTPAW